MKTPNPDKLRAIKTLPSLIAYLRDELDWPVEAQDMEDLTFEYLPAELGLDAEAAVKVREIKQLRPLTGNQPWGIFWVNFEKKRLPVSVLRRILRALVVKKRASANKAERQAWEPSDLLFICGHLQDEQDAITFVHFAQPTTGGRAARITSFGWTPDSGNRTAVEFNLPSLRWPEDPTQVDAWRAQWIGAFDVERVTKQFFREIANWYFWALQHVRFPKDAPKEADGLDHVSVIRLITRLIFCWFVKQKGLIPDRLFDEGALAETLAGFAPDKVSAKDSVFYRAILQNLFFATLNTEMDQRGWVREDQHFMAHSLYRHKECFRKPGEALDLFKSIPFLNGGLFECLDKDLGEDARKRYLRIDGFSRRPDSQPTVPDFLFFGGEREVDLSAEYGEARYKRAPVRGLIHTLRRYNFTIEENTPLDQEVALDPELSGKVFENLLAAYNPETGTTARKATGSFYTPREIVDYLVDEALIAWLKTRLEAAQPSARDGESRLRHLFAYTEEPHPFTPREVDALIAAIDGLKALDPGVGSGAFPMGVLHRLVFILGKLDPRNEKWKERQVRRVRDAISTAEKIEDAALRERAVRELEEQIAGVNEAFERNELDYGRKLYLIENCIYGVDIQPIAVQIAKMRFFISLIVDQKIDPRAPNLGIRPLPNLETKFVAANTLVGIEKPGSQGVLFGNPTVDQLKKDLAGVRHRLFTARTSRTKQELREKDKKIRLALAEEVTSSFSQANEAEMRKIRQALEQAEAALTEEQSKPVEWEVTRSTNLFGETEETRVDRSKERKRRLREQMKELESRLRRSTQFTREIDDTAKQLAGWDPYDQNAFASFFDPEWMFGLREGFDISIGNPPYVRIQTLPEVEAEYLKAHYAAAAKGNFDLYVVFVERALQMLSAAGQLAFILPHKFFNAQYGEPLRELLSKGRHLQHVVHFGDQQIFPGATNYVCLLFLAKAGAAACRWARADNLPDWLAGRSAIETNLPADRVTATEWNFAVGQGAGLFEKLQRMPVKLGDVADIFVGLQTSADRIFVLEGLGSPKHGLVRVRDAEGKAWEIERDILKSFLHDVSLGSYKEPTSGHWLVFPYKLTARKATLIAQTELTKCFPRMWRYFKTHEGELRGRESGKADGPEWFGYIYRKNLTLFDQPKLIVQVLSKKGRYASDTHGIYFTGGGNGPYYGIRWLSQVEPRSLRYLHALLNSRLLDFFHHKISSPFRGGYWSYGKQFIAQLPVAPIDLTDKASRAAHDALAGLAERVMAAKKADPAADTSALEREIDEHVYRLYGLTKEEIKIVEGAA